MNRAYAVLNVKEMREDEQEWVISGVASTPSPDREGDVMEPMGARFSLPMPMLWFHKADRPVGRLTFAKPTRTGITYEARIPKVKEPGTLKDRIDEAVQSIKYRLVAGVSIGFNPIDGKYDRIPGAGFHFKEWEWMELSLVSIPANAEASVTSIKSLCSHDKAASGLNALGSKTPPGVAGTAATPSQTRSHTMKTLHEELSDLKATRSEKAARMQELVELRTADNRRSTAAEAAEFDTLDNDVQTLDDDIRAKTVMAYQAGTAKAVSQENNTYAGSASRGPTIIVRNADPDDKFEGQAFTRMVIAKALASMEIGVRPSDVATARWGKTNPTLVRLIKANEVAGGSSDTWGSELVSADNRYTGDFISYLHLKTLFDQLPLRPVPADITIKGEDGVATGYWVGESKPIPSSTVDYSSVSLTPLKVGALAVVSNELLRRSSPAAEMLVRDALVKASAQRVDLTFFSASAAVAGVSPAGILNGVSAKTSTGTDAAGVRGDIAALYQDFITANNLEDQLHFVTTLILGKQLQLMRNALSQSEFPGVKLSGGTLEGDPLHTGGNVGSGDLILLNPQDIWKIDDRGVEVSISRDAMIEQSSAPTGATDTPVAASQVFTSMFQSESTAIKVVRSINFAKRRSSAVAYVGDAAYDASTL